MAPNVVELVDTAEKYIDTQQSRPTKPQVLWRCGDGGEIHTYTVVQP